MKIEVAFTNAWNDISENVEFLSVYKHQRAMDFPGVPVRQFSDWIAHRQWMRNERAKHLRMVTNECILLECEEAEQAEKQPKGS